jgi:riboflavin kinase / FMN adenylyltransferase
VKIHRELDRGDRALALAIGFFDGFHIGHREIARRTLRLRAPRRRSAILTFAEHPAAFLRPGQEPPLLSTPEERLCLFAEAGFDECYFLRFDERIATLSPQQFLDVLIERLHAAAVVVGSTFRFGHRRAGDTTLMREAFSAAGVEFCAVSAVTDGGERVSSTRIRELVAAGDTAGADRLLGGSGYELRGLVERGAGRGHRLGFPTANLRLPEKLLPSDGIYAAIARYDGRDYPALVSIGANPQFGGTQRTVEAWLRDFHHTIYGRELRLRELRRVREQRLFDDTDELIAQMQRDVAVVAYPSYG